MKLLREGPTSSGPVEDRELGQAAQHLQAVRGVLREADAGIDDACCSRGTPGALAARRAAWRSSAITSPITSP